VEDAGTKWSLSEELAQLERIGGRHRWGRKRAMEFSKVNEVFKIFYLLVVTIATIVFLQFGWFLAGKMIPPPSPEILSPLPRPSDAFASSAAEPARRHHIPTAALCFDGVTSYSPHRSGTCAGHGGVRSWLGGNKAGYSKELPSDTTAILRYFGMP
jgi:hypothetical protein